MKPVNLDLLVFISLFGFVKSPCHYYSTSITVTSGPDTEEFIILLLWMLSFILRTRFCKRCLKIIIMEIMISHQQISSMFLL